MTIQHYTLAGACLGLAALFSVAAWSATDSGAASSASNQAGVQIEKGDEALTVKINGKLFTRYVFANTPKPYCWPVIGPTGEPVTRAYPMEQIDGEKQDHPHQRSFWFTHGKVNDLDYWGELLTDNKDIHGRQVHRKFEAVEDGSKSGRIRAVNDWVTPDGKKVCEDTRELQFYATGNDTRLMDYNITVRASDGPVTFGDTKEGSFGIRVATSMDVDQKDKKPGGQIVNSRGETDAKAWGRPAEWVDYSGPVNAKTVGITIMNHPSSFRHPTHWHVRTYGLFAANPFGLHDFTNDKSKDGSHTVPKGESISFRYRILFHTGDVDAAKPAEAYAAYIKSSEGKANSN